MDPVRVSEEEAEALSRPRGYRWHSERSPEWARIADGGWWLVHSADSLRAEETYSRAWERIKRGSKLWADRHGYRRETRRSKADQKIWVRFLPEEACR